MAMLYGFGVHVMLIWLFWQPQIAVLEHRAILYYGEKPEKKEGGLGEHNGRVERGKKLLGSLDFQLILLGLLLMVKIFH